MFSYLYASGEAQVPLGKSVVHNPPILRRPHTRLHSFHIMTLEQSRLFWIRPVIKCGVWCKSESTRHQYNVSWMCGWLFSQRIINYFGTLNFCRQSSNTRIFLSI